VLASATTCTLGRAAAISASVMGVEGREVIHRGEEPNALALAHRLAQQLIGGLASEEPGLARGLIFAPESN